MAKITLIATGGARAPTHLALAERFLADGHEVRCIATAAARRFLFSHFVRHLPHLLRYLRLYRAEARETLAYFQLRRGQVPHVEEAKWPDVVVMAPATSNSIGKLVAGISDSLALLVLRAVPRGKKVIVVPSMNPEMWFDPHFQRNVDLLNATDKYRVLCPTRGEMLCGDFGFGAQVAFDEIVAETYRGLGIVDERVEAALRPAGRSLPWEEPGSEMHPDEQRVVVLVDEDATQRASLEAALARVLPDLRLVEFDTASLALAWLSDHGASLVVTELSFSSGATGFDLIDQLRRPGSGNGVHVIATSARGRQEVGAERLARDDVLFQPKPLNVPFFVGMVAGCLGTGRGESPRVLSRRLGPGDVLFEEGDKGSSIYVVQFGRLRVEKDHDGQRAVVGRIEAGRLVGEMAFLGDGTRSATVVADEPTAVLELDLEGVRDYLTAQPSWLRALIDSLIDHVHSGNDAAAGISGREWVG